MPEYLAPGVFVEEVSFRQKSIEGVSTSTTAFVGPTRFGPVFGEPELLTSFADFERIYGGLDRLAFDGQEPRHNFLAHAVRAYFEEGGRRLYVVRAFRAGTGDGRAQSPEESAPPGFAFEARYPGAAGNVAVTVRFAVGDNILTEDLVNPADPASQRIPVLKGAANNDVVVGLRDSPVATELYWVERYFDQGRGRDLFRLRRNNPDDAPDGPFELAEYAEIRVLRVSVVIAPLGRFGQEALYEDLDLHPAARRYIGTVLAADPVDRATELFAPLVFTTDLANGAAIAEALTARRNLSNTGTVAEFLTTTDASDAARSFRVQLTGGNDGALPTAIAYEGIERAGDGHKSGLRALEDEDEVSIVAAPGSAFDDLATADAVARFLISHCERMRYRVAVLDSVNGQTPGEVRQLRGTMDSTRAALYYPWVRVLDPVTESEIHLPPSGFVAGIYARNDVERGVQKAPANEVVRLALGLELAINTAQQEVLNPRGINCLRGFEGRGYRVWGARTASSDPEWKYLNVRRYFAYLERSIERGTQWAVFESNGDLLWDKVRRTVEDFLFNEWKENRLLGTKPELAFFVRCDRTTMSQNDIDNGRLICLIGVSPLRPAEFVIFRIGQKTADARG